MAERYLSHVATTKTINVSKGEQQLALDYHIDKKEKFTLIYNGIKEIPLEKKESIRQRLGIDKDRFIVGFTARCAEQKDPMTWLKIAEIVVKKRSDVDFIYIGDGPMQEEMEAWVRNRMLVDRIKIMGFRTDASQIVGMFDIYLRNTLEAMNQGISEILHELRKKINIHFLTESKYK